MPVDAESRIVSDLIRRYASQGITAPVGMDLPTSTVPAVATTRGPTGGTHRAGFAKPPGAAVRLRLDRLRSSIKAAAPRGKPRPTGYRVGKKFYKYTKAYTPGSLKASFDNAATVQMSANGKSIIVRNDLPYARIIDKGGRIPERHAKPGKFMMFPGGGNFFHKKARGFRIKGQHYVRDGLAAWSRRWGYNAKVRWAPFRGVRVSG